MESNDIKKLPRRDSDLISVTLKFENVGVWRDYNDDPHFSIEDNAGDCADFCHALDGVTLVSFECSDEAADSVYDLDGFELHLDKRDGTIELIDDEHDTETFQPEVMSAIADAFGWVYTSDKTGNVARDDAFACHAMDSENNWHIHYLVRTDELQIGCKRFSREQVEEFLDWYAVNWWQR